MNRRAFIGLLFAAPVVGPSIVKGLGAVAQKVAPKSVTAQELAAFINAHIAKTSVPFAEMKRLAAEQLLNTRKIGEGAYAEDMKIVRELLSRKPEDRV